MLRSKHLFSDFPTILSDPSWIATGGAYGKSNRKLKIVKERAISLPNTSLAKKSPKISPVGRWGAIKNKKFFSLGRKFAGHLIFLSCDGQQKFFFINFGKKHNFFKTRPLLNFFYKTQKEMCGSRPLSLTPLYWSKQIQKNKKKSVIDRPQFRGNLVKWKRIFASSAISKNFGEE